MEQDFDDEELLHDITTCIEDRVAKADENYDEGDEGYVSEIVHNNLLVYAEEFALQMVQEYKALFDGGIVHYNKREWMENANAVIEDHIVDLRDFVDKCGFNMGEDDYD